MCEQKQSLVEQFGEVSEALLRLWDRTLEERGIDEAKYVMEAFAHIEGLRMKLGKVPWE